MLQGLSVRWDPFPHPSWELERFAFEANCLHCLLSAELTTVQGTSEDLGCHAPGQESHTEGSPVGQPAPAPFPSPPQGLPPRQHQFASKTVRVPPLSWLLWKKEPGRGSGLGWVAKALLPPPRPSSACMGMCGGSGGGSVGG